MEDIIGINTKNQAISHDHEIREYREKVDAEMTLKAIPPNYSSGLFEPSLESKNPK